jgi:hypothetical protein
MYNIEYIWDKILDLDIATEEELSLVTSINGYNEESLNDIIYVRTGYRSIEQLMEELS